MPNNVSVTFADGTSHVYQNVPDNITPDQVEQRAQKDFNKQVTNLARAPIAPAAVDQTPKTGFIAGAKSGYESILGDIGAVGSALGISGAEEFAKKQREKAAQTAQLPEFKEAPWEYLKTLAGQAAPYMVAPLAAAAVTSEAPVVAAAGLTLTGAELAATAAGGLQFFGSNLSRQLEEGKSAKDLDIFSAAAAAPFQAALDTIGLKYIPGLRRVFGQAGMELSDEQLKAVVKKQMTENLAGKVMRYGTNAVKTAGIEGFNEAGQQVLERAQAGLSITDPDARQEYYDNFFGGALLGGAISIPGHAIETAGQRGKYRDILQKEKEAEEKKRAETPPLQLGGEGAFVPVGLPDGSIAMTREDLAKYEEQQFQKKYAAQPTEEALAREAAAAAEPSAPAMPTDAGLNYGTATQEIELLKRQPRTPENTNRIKELQQYRLDTLNDQISAARMPVSPELKAIREQMERGDMTYEGQQRAIDQILAEFSASPKGFKGIEKQGVPSLEDTNQEIKNLTMEANKLGQQIRSYQAGKLSGESMRPLLMNALVPEEVKDISPDKSFGWMKSTKRRGLLIADLVADGVLDKWLPFNMRHDAATFDSQDSEEYIKNKIRNKDWKEFESQTNVRELSNQLNAIRNKIEELKAPQKFEEEIASITDEERQAMREAGLRGTGRPAPDFEEAPAEDLAGAAAPKQEEVISADEYYPDMDEAPAKEAFDAREQKKEQAGLGPAVNWDQLSNAMKAGWISYTRLPPQQRVVSEQRFEQNLAQVAPAEKPAPAAPAAKPAAPAPAAEEQQRPKFYPSFTKLGYTRIDNPASPRIYTDKGGEKFLTFEKDGVRAAMSSNTILYEDENGRVQSGYGEPNESVMRALIVDPEVRGQGKATSAMQDIVNLADQSGTTLYLEPATIEGGKMSAAQLANFYKKFGFTQTKDNSNKVLVRKPREREAKTVQPAKAAPQLGRPSYPVSAAETDIIEGKATPVQKPAAPAALEGEKPSTALTTETTDIIDGQVRVIDEETIAPAVARLSAPEQQALADHYEEEVNSPAFLSKLHDDIYNYLINGAKSVAKAIREIIRKIVAVGMATTIAINPAYMSAPIPISVPYDLTTFSMELATPPAKAAARMSEGAQRAYSVIYPAYKKYFIDNNKLFIITDKPTAITFIFNPDGSLILDTKTLLGKKRANFYVGDVNNLENQITPAGLYTAGIRDARKGVTEYGGNEWKTAHEYDYQKVLVLDKAIKGEASVTLGHSVWLKDADAEERKKALKTEGASDARMTHACVNFDTRVFGTLLDEHEEQLYGAKWFIVPEDPKDTMDFITGAAVDRGDLVRERVTPVIKETTTRMPGTPQPVKPTAGGEAITEAERKRQRGRYQQAGRNEKGSTKEAVTSIVEKIKSTWKNAPKTNVVQSISELPKELRDQITSDKVNPRGIFDPETNEVWLIADNISTPAQAIITLAHEALGHFGLRVALGNKFSAMMSKVYEGNKAVRERADAYMEEGLSKEEAVEEVLAEMAQDTFEGNNVKTNLPILRSLMNVVRQFLARLGVPINAINDKQILELLANAKQSVVEGKIQAEETAKGRAKYLDTKSLNFKRWFKNSVVRNQDGSAKVMYHGTVSDFDEFLPDSHFGTAAAANQRARSWSAKNGERPMQVMPVYLSIENPLRVLDNEASDEAALLNAIKRGKYPELDLDIANRDGAHAAAKAAGYDGLVYQNNVEDKGKLSYVVFDPTQVKSVFNRGTFDPKDKRILYNVDPKSINFRRWFGKSKAVDKNGNPERLYHSTYSDVDVPITNFGPEEYFKFGMHVGSLDAATNRLDIKAAEDSRQGQKSGNAGANIMPVYVRAENPLRLNENRSGRWGVDDIMRQIMEKAEKEGIDGISDEDIDAWYNDAFDIESWLGTTPEVGSREYDPNQEERFWSDMDSYYPGERSDLLNAFIRQLGYDSIVYKNEFEGGGDSYILLDANQVKSATGNSGEYSRINKDIRYSIDKAISNFKRWFRNSKVVDKEGKPLVVYHGSPAKGITVFDTTRVTKRAAKGDLPGTYFTSDKAAAANFTREFGAKVGSPRGEIYAVYLSIQNPLNITSAIKKYQKQGMSFGDAKRKSLEALTPEHDGVIFDGDKYNHSEYIVFKPEQIKSATDNNGEYSLTNKNIRYSAKDRIERVAKRMANKRPEMQRDAFDGVDEKLVNKLNNIFFPENKTIVDRIEGMKDNFWKKLAQGVADQYRSIKDYTQEGYMLARMSKTIDGALEGLLFNGQVKLTDGALDIKQNTKGLMQAMEPVGKEVDRYQIWVALKREAQLVKEKYEVYDADKKFVGRFTNPQSANAAMPKGGSIKVKEGAVSSIDPTIVAQVNELSKGKIGDRSRIDVYEQVRKDMNALNRSVLDIAKAQGLINDEAYQIFANDINYIPFYKAMEDGDIQGAATASGLARQEFSKQLKGGEKPFSDLMENTLRNWSHILSASMKNKAANVTIDAAMEMGAAYPNLKVGFEWRDGKVYSSKSGELVNNGKLKPEYTTQKAGMVKTMLDGKPAYFEVIDPLLLDSISSIGYMGPKSKFLDVAKDFKNMLQFGVTLSPAFKVRNLFRDSISAMAVSDMKLSPFANVVSGWKASSNDNPAHISALAGGAIFNFGSYYEGDQSRLIKRLLKQGVEANSILDTDEKIKKGLAQAWRKYQEWGNKSESANRMALYQQMRDRGMSHLEASYYARDLLDFSMQGSWPAFRLVAQVVPFLNARVQGLYKLGRDGIIPTSRVIYNTVTGKPIELTDKQKAQQFGTVTAAVVLASMALYLMFKDDDEFQKREAWDRDNFWWFKLPGMDTALRVPKPFEIGAFGTMAERTLEQIIDQGAEGKQFEESLRRMLGDTFALNPTPQAIKPLLDLYANKDSFTGAPIETAGMERLSKQERASDTTSPLAKALGGVSNVMSTVFGEKTELSPVQIDYAIKAYFGWLGGTITTSSHYAVMPFSKSAYPDHDWADTVSLGFVKSLPATQSRYVTEFYQNSRQISEAYADMRHYAELGEFDKAQQILEENEDKIMLNKAYDKAAKDMAKMRQVISLIRNDETMSGAQKKEEIDRTKLLIDDIAKQLETLRKDLRK